MAASGTIEDSPVWMIGEYETDDLMLKRAVIREGLSKLTETTVEFKTKNTAIDMAEIVGKSMTIVVETPSLAQRWFSGVCIAVEHMGMQDGFSHFVGKVRPWLWLLTRTRNNRIFQDMNVIEIIEQVFSEHGFNQFSVKARPSDYGKREYCVQYRESDFDFISRLMQQEGLYYFFDNGTAKKPLEDMIICDGLSAHNAMPEKAELEFFAKFRESNRRGDFIGEWSEAERLTFGKVSLEDFDFLVPKGPVKVNVAGEKGSHSYNKMEFYDYPGFYRQDDTLGEKRAKVRMEAEAIRHKRWRGAGNVRNIAVGYTFTVDKHSHVDSNVEFLVTDVTHFVQHAADFDDKGLRRDLVSEFSDFPDTAPRETYTSQFGGIKKTEQFRAPLDTSWPRIPGLQTALVVGKDGDEISSDEFGRIKVKFHWDRTDAMNDTVSCWVRVVTPWSGEDWGMFALPRVGQEVVIQFEDGDPDRPICTGMLYNKDKKVPYDAKEHATQLGIKTNSSPGGGGYNELMFDDKADEELMRVQAQKDHKMLVKNMSSVSIGLEEMDQGSAEDGSLREVIRNNMNQVILEGEHKTTVEQGDMLIEVLEMDLLVGVDTGDIKMEAVQGEINIEAGTSITLTVGGSSIKLEPSKISIASAAIEIAADAKLDAGAPIISVAADGQLTLRGGLVNIN